MAGKTTSKTKWAAVQTGSGVAEHHWVALPEELHGISFDGPERRWMSSIKTDAVKSKPGWGLRAGDTHVWFGVNGRIEHTLGKEHNGVLISDADGKNGSGRPGHGFSGYVAQREKGMEIPAPPSHRAAPGWFDDHRELFAQNYFKKDQDKHLTEVSKYKTCRFPKVTDISPEHQEAWEEAAKRIAAGETFELKLSAEQKPVFSPLTREGFFEAMASNKAKTRRSSGSRSSDARQSANNERAASKAAEGIEKAAETAERTVWHANPLFMVGGAFVAFVAFIIGAGRWQKKVEQERQPASPEAKPEPDRSKPPPATILQRPKHLQPAREKEGAAKSPYAL